MPRRAAPHPRYLEHPITKADFARRSKRTRSSITEASQGPLAPACRPDGRIDAAHPAAVTWARARGIDPKQLLEPLVREMRESDGRRVRRPTALTFERLATLMGMSVEDVAAAAPVHFPEAFIPDEHVDAERLAFLAGCGVDEVLAAVDSGELGPAVQRNGCIDLTHGRVVAFAARRPFEDELRDAPDGYLAPAMLAEQQVDAAHPVAVIFLARCLGRAPTAAELT